MRSPAAPMYLLALVLSCGVVASAAAAAAAGGAAGAGARGEGPEVEVDIPELGKLLGKETSTARGVPIYKFLGIPFAAKPDRFQPPTRFATWSGTLDTLNPAPGCPGLPLDALGSLASVDIFFPGATAAAKAAEEASATRRAARDETGDADPEDCLTLDIYTHSVNPESRAPVLFYIHGGAFVMGTSQMANGDFLLDHGDIVLVSVQYRLGPPGFLLAEEAGAPGNAALHDLVWALRWVREHIHVFGGNPDHIVVGGVSAGAALSGLLVVSPEARDWIHGVALFSGGALVPWTVDTDPYRSTRAVGVFAGCLSPDTLAECLRSRSPALLNVAWGLWTVYETYFANHGMGGVIPALDPLSPSPLLPRSPLEEMMDSNFPGKPMLIGVTKHEGTFLMIQVDLLYMKARALTEDERTLVHEIGDLMLRFSDVSDPIFTLGDTVKRLYFCEEALGNYTAMFEGLVDFTGAGFFKGPAQRMAQLNAAAGGQSYLFSFDYAGENREPSSLMGGDASTVHHGNDQHFLFKSTYDYTENDMEIVDIYSNLVVSFVTDLKPNVPNVDWREHTLEDDTYLSVRLPPEARQGFSNEFYVMEQDRQAALEEDDVTSTTVTDSTPSETESTPAETDIDTSTTVTDSTPSETESTPEETDNETSTSVTDSTPSEIESSPVETESTPEEISTPTDSTTDSTTYETTTEDASTVVPFISMLLLSLIPLRLC